MRRSAFETFYTGFFCLEYNNVYGKTNDTGNRGVRCLGWHTPSLKCGNGNVYFFHHQPCRSALSHSASYSNNIKTRFHRQTFMKISRTWLQKFVHFQFLQYLGFSVTTKKILTKGYNLNSAFQLASMTGQKCATSYRIEQMEKFKSSSLIIGGGEEIHTVGTSQAHHVNCLVFKDSLLGNTVGNLIFIPIMLSALANLSMLISVTSQKMFCSACLKWLGSDLGSISSSI